MKFSISLELMDSPRYSDISNVSILLERNINSLFDKHDYGFDHAVADFILLLRIYPLSFRNAMSSSRFEEYIKLSRKNLRLIIARNLDYETIENDTPEAMRKKMAETFKQALALLETKKIRADYKRLLDHVNNL